ncbi:hypothetical protein GJU93_06000 [Brucella sp. 10RB9212]|nr:hypothetical protein BKD02_01675 [Brucella sp. 09RB8910]MRN46143.1 hypothetical protein [Brucella sp. 10RB9212]
MDQNDLNHFIDTVAVATYANKAVLTCLMAGKEISEDAALEALSNWVSRTNPNFEGLAEGVRSHVREMIEAARSLRPLSPN